MSRAYLRIDPALYERKVIEQGYPLPLFAAFVGVLCLAEHQPRRGTFRDAGLLRALLGPSGRFVAELVKRGDLVAVRGGHLYVDGWNEWQEGDWTVADRLARLRNRRRESDGPATPPDTVPDTVRETDAGTRHRSNSAAVGISGRVRGVAPRDLTSQEKEAATAAILAERLS